jgi:hypothetical protein
MYLFCCVIFFPYLLTLSYYKENNRRIENVGGDFCSRIRSRIGRNVARYPATFGADWVGFGGLGWI